MESKTCRGCGEEKPLDEFHADRRARDGRSARCGACRSRVSREWYHRDPEARQAADRAYYERERDRILDAESKRQQQRRIKNPAAFRQYRATYMREWRAKNLDRQKDYELRARNGTDLVTYERLFQEQGGVCAICGQPPASGKYLSVDHCHKSNKIRGLLCRNCNLAIGHLRDNPEWCEEAARYLRK